MSTSRFVVRLGAGVSLALAFVTLVTPAVAQQAAGDSRWRAWIGCWEPERTSGPTLGPANIAVCITPAAGGVDVATVVAGRVVSHERVVTGDSLPSEHDNCSGWQSARWSANAARLFRIAEHLCADLPLRRATMLMAISEGGTWVDVQTISAGGRQAVWVVRYRPARSKTLLPAEIAAAIGDPVLSPSAARIAATVPLTNADVVEAARLLDTLAVEAMVAELGERFDVNGRRLLELADQGVSAGVIDLMVALSYPKLFAVNRDARRTDVVQDSAAPALAYSYGGVSSPFYSSPFDYGPYAFGRLYGYRIGNGYGYGYGYGNGYGYLFGPDFWYPPTSFSGGPVIVTSTSGGSVSHGRVVAGSGYSSGGSTSGSVAHNPSTRAESGEGGARGGVSGGGYSPGASSGGTPSGGASTSTGSSSPQGGDRTAKPRP